MRESLDTKYPTIGDLIEVDGEPKVITEIHIRTDEIVTQDGESYFAEHIERIPAPPGDLEAWLEGPTFRVRTVVLPDRDETHRCEGKYGNCKCRSCYHVSYFKNGEEIHREHYVDNDGCTCDQRSDCC